MGDPICKWRNATVWTLMELVTQLPKVTMSNASFRDHMQKNSIYGASFNRTCYQLACQLGLYYIDEYKKYIPRFDHDLTEREAEAYLQKWIQRYYVPNPYTARKFDSMDCPLILLHAIINFVEEHPKIKDLKTICNFIFGEETGNILCVKYILNEYSKRVHISSENEVNIMVDADLVNPTIPYDRNDKKAFFETFNH